MYLIIWEDHGRLIIEKCYSKAEAETRLTKIHSYFDDPDKHDVKIHAIIKGESKNYETMEAPYGYGGSETNCIIQE